MKSLQLLLQNNLTEHQKPYRRKGHYIYVQAANEHELHNIDEHASKAVLPVAQCFSHWGQEHLPQKKPDTSCTRDLHLLASRACQLDVPVVSGVVRWMA